MDDSSSSSSSSSMKDLLPLMMMSGGMGGAPGAQGAMNPMLMLALMDDSSSCTVKNAAVKALALTDDEKKSLANGSKCYDASTKNKEHIDYDFIKCEGGSSGMSDLLPLMMMGGGMGGGAAGGMDPMMMMLMMDDEKTGKEGCDAKHKISKVFLTSGVAETDMLKIRAAVEGSTILAPTVKSKWITDYAACLANPTTSSSSSSMKD